MFNRRLFAITGEGEVPVPVDVPQASFVPIRNQWGGNNTEYNPTLRYPKTLLDLGCTDTIANSTGRQLQTVSPSSSGICWATVQGRLF